MTGLHLREVEDVVDERQQMSAAVEDIAEILLLFGVELTEEAFEKDLGEADDGVERRAELVGHAGKKLGFVAVGGLELMVEPPELCGHAVQIGGEGAEFVPIRDVDALREIARGDLARAARPCAGPVR